MAIQFSCENCQQPIEVDDEAANQRARCPYCQVVVQVPSFSDMSITEARPQPTASLQTALPVPHRQGAPATPQIGQNPADSSHRPATLGYMALVTIIISIILCVVVMITIVPVVMPLMPQQPGAMPDMDKVQPAIEGLAQSKPWVGVAAAFFELLGLTGFGLAIASLVRQERPRWPAMSVLGVTIGFIAMMVCSGLVFGMFG